MTDFFKFKVFDFLQNKKNARFVVHKNRKYILKKNSSINH